MDFSLLAHSCNNPTYSQGMTMSTCAYYPPIFDENGNNLNPDRNVTTTSYYCTRCGKGWEVCTQYGEKPQVKEIIRYGQ